MILSDSHTAKQAAPRDFPGRFCGKSIEKQAGNASQESLDQAADAEGFGCSFEGFIV